LATPAAILSVLVKTQGAQAAAAQLMEVDTAAKRASGSMDKASASAKGHGKMLGGLGHGLGSAAKGAAAFVGAYAGFHVVKESVDTTEALAKTTMTLSKNYGLATKTASEWAAVGRARDMDGKQLTMGFKTLSKQIASAASGSKTAGTMFKQLGISQKELKEHGDNLNWVMHRVSDGLGKMPGGTKKAAVMGTLFGRTWQKIAPIIREGSKAMDEQLGLAAKYGATFGGKSIKSVEGMVKAQREAKLASMGLSITLGTTLVPLITKVVSGVARFALAFRNGTGSAGQLRDGIDKVIGVLSPFTESIRVIVDWLGRHTTVAKVLVGVLGGLALGVWAVNAAMAANPITLVVVALGLLAVGLVTAYRKCAVFRDVVNTVWDVLKFGFNWIKGNWPLLLAILTGPFGLAALLIVKHFDAIKGVVSGAFNWIKGNWPLLLAILTGPFGLAALLIVKHWDTIKGIVGSVFGWIRDHWPLLLAILAGPFALAVVEVVKHAHAIRNAVVGAFNAMVGAIKALAGTLVNLGVWVLARIIQGIKSYVAALLAIGGWIKNRIMDGLSAVVGGLRGAGGWVLHRIVDGLKADVAAILAIGGWLKGRLMDGLRAVAGGIAGMGGWVVARFVDGIKSTFDKIKSGAKWIVDKVVGAVKGFLGISSPSKVFEGIGGHMIEGLIKGMGKADVVKFVAKHLGGAAKLAADLAGRAAGAVAGVVKGGIPAMAGMKGNVKDWLTQALKATGHYSKANLAALYGRTMQESGGNPRAINLTDSNAAAGHPSKGLLQTIDSTFSSFSLGGSIWNPVANAIAAIRYMYATYGHIVGPSSTGYAKGGQVPGTGSGDTVPAMLTPGEFVMRKAAVDKYGPAFFAALNMKTGGSVGTAAQKKQDAAEKKQAAAEKKHAAALAAQRAKSMALELAGWRKAAQMFKASQKARAVNPTFNNPWLQAYLAHQDYQLASGGFDAQAAAQGVTAQAIANANKVQALTNALPLLTSEADKLQALNEIASLGTGADTGTSDTGTSDNTDAMNALNDTIKQLSDQLEQQRQEALRAQQAYNVSQSQYAVLSKAISDVANGGIGGRVGLGFMTPGFAGGGVRY
jgi:SLT domain-containing protein